MRWFSSSKRKPEKVLMIISPIGVECVYCHAHMRSEMYIYRCPICLSLHHIECWKENMGCGIFGCPGASKKK